MKTITLKHSEVNRMYEILDHRMREITSLLVIFREHKNEYLVKTYEIRLAELSQIKNRLTEED